MEPTLLLNEEGNGRGEDKKIPFEIKQHIVTLGASTEDLRYALQKKKERETQSERKSTNQNSFQCARIGMSTRPLRPYPSPKIKHYKQVALEVFKHPFTRLRQGIFKGHLCGLSLCFVSLTQLLSKTEPRGGELKR